MKKLISIAATMTLILVVSYRSEVLTGLTIFGVISLCLGTLFGLVFILRFAGNSVINMAERVEGLRMIRAARIEKTKQANVLTVTANGQVFVRDTDKAAVWTAMHLSQKITPLASPN